jgi:hypothetical protein
MAILEGSGFLPKMEKFSRCMVCSLMVYYCSDNVEPSSAEVLGNVADMSRDDFIRAINIADKGYRKYFTSTTFAERGTQLRKWFDLVHENLEDCIITTFDYANPQWQKS